VWPKINADYRLTALYITWQTPNYILMPHGNYECWVLSIWLIYLLGVNRCDTGAMLGYFVHNKKIPVGMRFSARPDRPWGPPSFL